LWPQPPTLCSEPPTSTLQVPRAPLHVWGVTPPVVISRTTSTGVTPSSLLIRTHAPDQKAPIGFGFPYSNRSLQVVVTPCCPLALPDVISANLSLDAWTHTPAVLLVHMLVSSQETSAFTDVRAARHSTISVLQLRYRSFFGAAVILSCSGLQICSPPRMHLPRIAFRFSGQPWLLRPRISRFVTSPSSGYASRPKSSN